MLLSRHLQGSMSPSCIHCPAQPAAAPWKCAPEKSSTGGRTEGLQEEGAGSSWMSGGQNEPHVFQAVGLAAEE